MHTLNNSGSHKALWVINMLEMYSEAMTESVTAPPGNYLLFALIMHSPTTIHLREEGSESSFWFHCRDSFRTILTVWCSLGLPLTSYYFHHSVSSTSFIQLLIREMNPSGYTKRNISLLVLSLPSVLQFFFFFFGSHDFSFYLEL